MVICLAAFTRGKPRKSVTAAVDESGQALRVQKCCRNVLGRLGDEARQLRATERAVACPLSTRRSEFEGGSTGKIVRKQLTSARLYGSAKGHSAGRRTRIGNLSRESRDQSVPFPIVLVLACAGRSRL